MAESHEITKMIPRMKEGDDEAAGLLWDKYFAQLVRFARRRLEGVPRGAGDEEDVALSAMHSFCRGMEAGRFQRVDDRQDLWKLLVTIAARKAHAKRRHEYAEKRNARRTKHEGSFLRRDSLDEGVAELAELAVEPSPELADLVVSNFHELLACLDETARQIALWRLEGYSTAEIAENLGCVRRTVERKLERIRDKWSRMGLGPARD
jgi:RNA polymerase sigma factor (sigma-70 family)